MARPETLQPTWDLKRKKPTQQEELEAQKAQMEKQLRDRAQRLSRLSMRLTQSGKDGKNNLTTKLKAFEVEQINAQLEELQNGMKQEERERQEQSVRDKRRQQEEADLRKRTETLERAYKEIDPNAVDPAVSLKAQRRRTAMMSIRGTAGWSEEEYNQMQKQQEAEEQKEVQDRERQRTANEKKLRSIEDEIKRKERLKEEDRVKAQQRQLAAMEKKLKDLEENIDKDDDGVMTEDQLAREIERRRGEWRARQDAERKAREKQLVEAERIQRERDEAVLRRKGEMEKRVREVEMALQEKQREREEERLRKQADKLAKMEAELAQISASEPNDEYESQVKTYDYMMMEKKVRELQGELDKRKNGQELQLDEKMKQLKEKEAMLAAVEAKNAQIDQLVSKMGLLEAIFAKLNTLSAGGGMVMGGGGGGGAGVNTVAELKKEIERLQTILFSPQSSEKEIAEANIKLEKCMSEYEKTSEYQTEVARVKAEKKAKHEPLNKAAKEKMKQIYNPQSVKQNPELLQKIGESPELRFLFMEPDTILKLHPADFKSFTMRNLSLDELRAIRACMPNFRRDQTVQQGWMETLDEKIEGMSSGKIEESRPRPAPSGNKPAWKPKAVPAAGAGAGDVFAELLAKKGKLNASAPPREGGYAGGGGPPPPPPPMSASAPSKGFGKLPPLPGKGGPLPPPPPPSGMGNAPLPPPPSGGGGSTRSPDAPPSVSLDQFKKVKSCLEKLLKGLATATPNEKDIAQDTRVAVTEIKQLARLQKAKYPDIANDVEDSASELVVAVKAVLVSRKTGGPELQSAKAKLAQVIDMVRNHCIKVLGPNAREYIK